MTVLTMARPPAMATDDPVRTGMLGFGEGAPQAPLGKPCYPCEMRGDVHVVLARRPDWDEGAGRLRLLWERNGAVATERANQYGNAYSGRRGSMVFDVVASRQRKYDPRVLSMVAAWERAHPPRYARQGYRSGRRRRLGWRRDAGLGEQVELSVRDGASSRALVAVAHQRDGGRGTRCVRGPGDQDAFIGSSLDRADGG